MTDTDYTIRSVRTISPGLQQYEIVDRKGRIIKTTVSKLSYSDPVRLDRIIRLAIKGFPNRPKDVR